MLGFIRHEIKTSSTALLWVILFSTLIISFAIFDSFYLKLPNVQSILSSRKIDQQTCEMTWSRPSYIEIQHKPDSSFSKKYTLYLYREGYLDSDQLQGVPALFIPGQAGSYKQVRSLAAETATYYYDHYGKQSSFARTIDYFTVDLNEELSALNGQTILDQAEYMNAVIRCILELYKNSPQNPSSVVIVGHSMGGLVARTMFMSPNYTPGTINTIVTLASPHLKAPLLLDPVIYKTYKKLTEFWTPDQFDKNPLLKDVSIISITGGFLDTIVDSNGANLEPLVPKTHGFSVISSSIPFVWTGCDHMAILWCNQLIKVVAKSLVEITDISTSAQTMPLLNRIEVFKRYLVDGFEPKTDNHLVSIHNFKKHLLPSGSFLNYSFDDPTKPSLILMERSDVATFTTNIPVHLDSRCSIVLCKDVNTQEMDCNTAISDITILPSATADKPIMADPFRLITVKNTHLKKNGYMGIIDKGGPAIPGGFILSDNNTKPIEHIISFWDILTGNTKFNVSGYYSSHIFKNKMSSVLAYSLCITEIETKVVRFKPWVRLTMDSNESQFYRKLEARESHRITFHKTVSGELSLDFFTDSQYLEFTLLIDWYGTLGRTVLGYGGIIVPFLYSNALIMAFSQLFTYLMKGKSIYVSFSNGFMSCLKGSFLLILNILVAISTLQVMLNRLGLWKNNSVISILQHNVLLGCDDISLPIVVALMYILSIGILAIIWLVISFLVYIINIPLKQFARPRVKSQKSDWRMLSIHAVIIAVAIQLLPTSVIFMLYYIIWLFMTASVRTKSDLPSIRNIYNFRQSWLIFLTSLLPYHLPSFIVSLKNILLGWTTFNISIDELVQDTPILYLLALLVTIIKTPDVLQLRWVNWLIIILNCNILYQLLFGFSRPFLLSTLV